MLPFESISVAPMEGFTTFPMRLFLHMTSDPKAMTTPFLKVTRAFPLDNLPGDYAPELFELRGRFPYSIVPQYIAGEVDCFLRATELLPEAVTSMIELNCGCPSPNSMGKYAGSGILQDQAYFSRSLERIIAELGASRVAIKMRIGVTSESEFSHILDGIQGLEMARLTIHGRTRKAGYRGRANWSAVEEAAVAFEGRVPILASGDVVSHESLLALQATAPRAQGVMIGRGVLRNPWIFEELKSGRRVQLSAEVFLHALYSYLLIQELWHAQTPKFVARVASGRIGAYCGTDAAAWEKQAIELSSLALGLPLLPRKGATIRVSPVAFERLKILWTYLRGSLPSEWNLKPVSKSDNPTDFFELLALTLPVENQFFPIEITE